LGLSDQVTAVLPVPPVTVAVNCWVCEAESEAVDGASVRLAGAVYRPELLMVPTLGLSDQVTAVLPVPPVTVAVNCWVCEAVSDAVVGVIETFTGTRRVMVADADFEVSATLVAVTVTICALVMEAGAI
jgi:hypothetical protein